MSPRRRLCQRAAHAWGGVTGGLGENLCGIEDASKGLGCRLGCCLPVADVQHRPTRQRRPSAGRCPPGTSAPASFLSRKLGKELYPPTARTCAILSMSTSGASCHGRESPGVQPPRTCAILSMSTSEASCHGRELPGVQPPRTCAILSMSTSAASCHRRELRAQALGRGRALAARRSHLLGALPAGKNAALFP